MAGGCMKTIRLQSGTIEAQDDHALEIAQKEIHRLIGIVVKETARADLTEAALNELNRNSWDTIKAVGIACGLPDIPDPWDDGAPEELPAEWHGKPSDNVKRVVAERDAAIARAQRAEAADGRKRDLLLGIRSFLEVVPIDLRDIPARGRIVAEISAECGKG